MRRDPDKVLADVRSGYVSLEAARRHYGVAIDVRGRRYDIDMTATEELRKCSNTRGRRPRAC
jgi:N-methylhydantoinase B/oxoprolinase/acetone carboxylase alpha subunit